MEALLSSSVPDTTGPQWTERPIKNPRFRASVNFEAMSMAHRMPTRTWSGFESKAFHAAAIISPVLQNTSALKALKSVSKNPNVRLCSKAALPKL